MITKRKKALMKYFKITSVILIIILLSMSFSACGIPDEQEDDFIIVTSFYPMYVFTKNITEGAENVKVINMTEPQTGCLHDYKLLPEDIKTLEKADVFVINGGGMEAFMEKLYENISGLNVITASDGIEFINTECDEHHDHTHEEEFNSHVWTYVPNAIKEVENITKGLISLNSENEKIYKENSEKYIKSLNGVHEKFKALKSIADGKEMVVTHEAFDYMANGYGLKIAGRIMSDHNSQPSAHELSELVKKVKNVSVIGIFKEPQYPDGVINTLTKETKVPVYDLDPMVTGEDEYLGVYESVMLDNLKTIENALNFKGYGD